MRKLTLKAPAKVNLTLEVLGRREDGYHDIASIIQTIDLHDTLTLEPESDITFECSSPDLVHSNNLVLRAARLLKAEAGSDLGAHIRLDKKIPVAAGLGGGSSDAAATLRGLNQLWRLGLPVDELIPIATRLGSDVPFFLSGGTAMVQGRGERVRTLPPIDIEWLLVLAPPIHIGDKTATVYSSLSPSNHTKGHLSRKLEARIRGGGDVPPQLLFNVFDEVAPEVFPGLNGYWESLVSLAAREVHVAGSGPSLFAPVSRKEQGTAIELMLRHSRGWEAHLVSPWQPPEGDLINIGQDPG